MEGRHVGLDFYDLLIEVKWRFLKVFLGPSLGLAWGAATADPTTAIPWWS